MKKYLVAAAFIFLVPLATAPHGVLADTASDLQALTAQLRALSAQVQTLTAANQSLQQQIQALQQGTTPVSGAFQVTSQATNSTLSPGDFIRVTWTSTSGNGGKLIDVSLLNSNDATKSYPLLTRISSTGGSTPGMNIPSSIPTGSYRVKVSLSTNPSVFGLSQGQVSISNFIADNTNSNGAFKPTIVVTYPNGGESLTDGQPIQISWNTLGAPNGSTVGIEITGTVDGADEAWFYPVGSFSNPVTGSLSWTPRVLSHSGELYKVKALLFSPGATSWSSQMIASDLSNSTFSVNLPSGVTRSISVSTPAAGATLQQGQSTSVQWSSSAIQLGDQVQVGYRNAYSSAYQSANDTVIATVTNSGSYNWQVPVTMAPGQYVIDVSYINEYGVASTMGSSGVFTVSGNGASQALIITSPVLGTAYQVGQPLTVTWDSTGLSASDIVYARLAPSANTASTSDTILFTNITNPHLSYDWTIPSTTAAGSYVVRFEVVVGSGASATFRTLGVSPSFTIGSVNPFTVTAPAAGDNWEIGSTHTIAWSGTGDPVSTDSYGIYLVNSGLSAQASLIATAPVSATSVHWQVPSSVVPGSSYQIAVSSTGGTVTDESGTFSISNPSSATTPASGSKSVTLTSQAADLSLAERAPIKVTWTSVGEAKTKLITLSLVSTTSSTAAYTLRAHIANKGSSPAGLIVPAAVPAGTYRIRISFDKDPGVIGWSSGVVTVTAY